MEKQKRSIGADIIRCFALFLVVSVHFFFHNGYYKQVMVGERMLVMTIMREFFMICVPLFITLSGYLLCKKELSIRYYSRIWGILITYVLASLLCITYSAVFLEENFTFKSVILNILGFSGAPYAWYVEMYLGLFLLIPFLNILYNNIPSQKWKLALVCTFIVLTSLPSMLNVYNFDSASWWSAPALSSKPTSQLIPAWWVSFYPITYYFIGCYLRDYGLKIKRHVNLLLIVGCTLLSGFYSFWRSYKYGYVSGPWTQEYSLFNAILTPLVFAFFININYDKVPEKAARFFQKISSLCLGGYLVSWIYDAWFYPLLLQKVPEMIYRMEFYFIIVPAVYVLSLLTSFLLSLVQQLLQTAYTKTVCLIKKPR